MATGVLTSNPKYSLPNLCYTASIKVHQFNSVNGITSLNLPCEGSYCALVRKGGCKGSFIILIQYAILEFTLNRRKYSVSKKLYIFESLRKVI
jgi:hypothetical protein